MTVASRWLEHGVRILAIAGLAACGTQRQPPANRTFYDWSLGDSALFAFELPNPRLDWPRDQANADFVGVEVLRGAVRFSRPRDWLVRDASNEPGAAYVHYVSPKAYSFAIYERHARGGEVWADLLPRYEAEIKAAGGSVVGRRVPMATSMGQGRAYSIETKVPSSGGAFVSHSREMLVRGEQRLILIQVVQQEETLASVDHELLRAIGTLEVH